MGEAMSLKDILFGKASQESSQSESTQIGGSAASSFGRTGSGSSSSSFGASTSQDRVAFDELFASLYGGSAAAAGAIDTGAISGAAERLFSGGLDFLQQLQGNAGTDALAARIGDTSARDAQLETLRTQLGDLFNEQLIPGITSEGVATGTLGGSRSAVAKAQAAKSVAGQFSTGAASIISEDQRQRDAAATSLAEFGLTGAEGGLNALGDLYGLAASGETAALTPYEILSQIMGGPTVLGSSQATDVASALSSSFGEEGSQSYGFDFGTSKSSSQGRGGTQGLAQAFLAGGGLGLSFKG